MPAPNKNRLAFLSSGRRFGLAALALLSVAAAGATLAWQTPDASSPPTPAAIASGTAAPALPPRTDALWPAIDGWNRLRRNDRLPFEDYATFLIAHPGWPGEPALRRAAERAIQPDAADPTLVARFLTLFTPTTAAGRVRLAEALAATGRTAEARDAAARAWTVGAMAADDENRLLARFAGQFTPVEQDQRMERLLWDRATPSALRQLPLASPTRQPLYAIRLAFQTRSTDAGTRAAALGPGGGARSGLCRRSRDLAARYRARQRGADLSWAGPDPRHPAARSRKISRGVARERARCGGRQPAEHRLRYRRPRRRCAAGRRQYPDGGARPARRLYQLGVARRLDRADQAQSAARCRGDVRALCRRGADAGQPGQGRILGGARGAGGGRRCARQQPFRACRRQYRSILRPACHRTSGPGDRHAPRPAAARDRGERPQRFR